MKINGPEFRKIAMVIRTASNVSEQSSNPTSGTFQLTELIMENAWILAPLIYLHTWYLNKSFWIFCWKPH